MKTSSPITAFLSCSSGCRGQQTADSPGHAPFALPARSSRALISLLLASAAFAQGPRIAREADRRAAAPVPSGADAASLSALLQEAQRDNPSIRAARQGWRAAGEVPSQVATLPDPEVQLQQFSVGSPRPFAGFTSSNFAYAGVGISQGLPYPGKLRLRGEIARRDAEADEQQYEAVRRAVFAELKSVYFRLAYLAKTFGILEGDGALLKQVTEAARARYRSGMGTQQDLIQAQLEQTELLQEVTRRRLERDRSEAQIKQLLDRPQSSPDIEPAGISETPLPRTYEALLAAAEANDPEIGAAQRRVEAQSSQVALARKDFYPDFVVQYMVQRTDPAKYAAYYMATLGVRVPLFTRRRQRRELAQARALFARSRSDYEAQRAQIASELRADYATADRTAELLAIYRGGLDPQAHAEFRAGLAGYESGRQDFQGLLAAFLDVLRFDEGYWRNLAAYETAVAGLEQLTGLPLRNEGARP
ncbi:MAG: TolC family protein [Opitutaceae bacterium]